MDSITQGAIGAAAAQAVYGEKLGRWSLIIGWGAGMLADADVLFRSASDPLYGWVMHRGFTHGLAFIPVGALIATLPFLLARSLRPRWAEVYGAAFLGYATHALLDACTAYGTQLLWPFSNMRVAWDIVSIVDPIYTFTLLGGVIASALRRRPGPARWALLLSTLYIGVCAVQHARAVSAQETLAAARGHQREAGRVMPSLGQCMLFRSVYRTSDGELWADGVRVPFLGAASVREGAHVPVFDPVAEIDMATAADPERLRRDLERARWFMDGYWARTPAMPELVGDMRFALDTAELEPLWGVLVAPEDPLPVRRESGPGERSDALGPLWREITGEDSRYRPLPPSSEQRAPE
ncbi:metal-dependent hydrolase [Haliangium ochraceum]|uniref:Membrane-bound metal-dependent hydrolase n=1 Tax=Haliangium ochraceum (strain DSM 14365 / JCM 11303 / SMP-2) TaxID=502025 RepID=D0LL23_HALO1|nr:metal-dependent hydrolase [Haliangium ochraceum]ACY16743.1 membrane-bound metal-dependent hydrolase [Haliangium ochraceum DSM 14365]